MTAKSVSYEWLFLVAILSSMAVGLLPALLKSPIRPEPPLKTGEKVVISIKNSFYQAKMLPRFSILSAVIAICFVALIYFKFNDLPLALATLAACSFAVALPLINMKIKDVAVTDNGLLISDFSTSTIVPFADIKAITTRSGRAVAAYVFVEFDHKGPFGKKIYFIPVDRRKIKQLLMPHGVTFDGPNW